MAIWLLVLGCFDPITGAWTLLMTMTWERVSHSAFVITGKLYIVGGHEVQRRLNSVECFDTGSGSWQTLPPMSTQRIDHSASFVAGQLYVVGRYDGLQMLNSI